MTDTEMLKNAKQQKNNTLNIIKLFAACLVVFIHNPFPGIIGEVIDCLARCAVPFFFMVSGYFFYKPEDFFPCQRAERKIRKNIKLLISVNILYMFWELFKIFIEKRSLIEWIEEKFNLRNVFEFLFYNLSPFQNHLWFIGALVYCYVVVWFIGKLKLKLVYIYVPILMLFNFIFGEILCSFAIIIPVQVYRNWLFTGLPFFLIGYYIRSKEKDILIVFNNKKLIMGIIFGSVFTVFERFSAGKMELYVGTVITVFLVFIWGIKNKDVGERKNLIWLSMVGEKTSIYIYILHPVFAYFLMRFISNTRYSFPILLCIGSIMISLGLYETRSRLSKVLGE